jgi:hypothetical protein
MKGNTMAKMFDIEPVVLSLKLTVTKATENGLLGGVTDVEVVSANGEADTRFYGFASNWGSLVLNYKSEGRPAKPAKADKPAPKPLTATQKAKVAALEAKIGRIEDPEEARAKAYAARHRKAKAEPAAPAAPAAPDMAAIVAAVMAAMQK